MSQFTPIDIGELEPPLIFADPRAETIFEELKARLIALNPEYEPALALESEELTIAMQTVAYRLSVHQQDCNEGILQQLLAFANGANLDWLGEVTGVGSRHVIDEGDPTAQPPIDPTEELDAAYRRRIQLAPEGYSTAGPVGSYIFHALASDPRVKDADAFHLMGGDVAVPILSHDGEGVASADLVNAVHAALNVEKKRPLNDVVQVVSAEIIPFAVDATLHFYSGPDRALAFDQARARLVEFVQQRHRLGDDVPISGIYAALHIPGVVAEVELRAPAETIAVARTQAAFCDPDTGITLIDGGSLA